MTNVVISVTPVTPVIEVAYQMRESGQNYIPVCEGGRLQGIITERDIVIYVVADGKSPIMEPAGSVMHKQQPVILPNDDVEQAAERMVESNVCLLPVVAQSGQLLGVLTIEELARGNPDLAALVVSKISSLNQLQG